MAAVFVLVVAVTVVGIYAWRESYPRYKATGWVEFKGPAPQPLFGREVPPASKDIVEQFMNSQTQLIQYVDNVTDALRDPEVKQTTWYRSFLTVDEAKIDMQKRLAVKPIPNTWFIRVSFTWRDPDEAAKLVNAVPPLETDRARWSVNVPVGMGVGLILGIVAAFLRARRNLGVSATDEPRDPNGAAGTAVDSRE